ncbi:TonB-dependent receptor plug domain-containing protein [Novosphingobium sediminicola]|uniref:Iron complex outermembrane receptor protein n=1 Tax=Novosphingobium sediminicola TaxID=563162 RepID=A0A7W6CFN9_9SPHN|nr:TonB-dependent receptor [Novosphingobium sediminicola]MBB3954977.1 iron complex outermembrane receptor protein [Novosphingobium sediminicola]
MNNHKHLRGAWLRHGVAALSLVTTLASAPAFAQSATAATASEPETIVVTGTLFRRTNTETPSPVTVLTSESLIKAGITNASDAIRSISADGAGSIGSGFQSGFSAGGSAVSLRGLGVSSTLVLVDGLRSANFPLNDDGHNAYVDLNSIPFSLIDKIEVLKDGASSSYGADAIGGVVNLKLKKNFVGVAGNAESGISERGDGRNNRLSLTAGFGDYENQGWNFYLNGEYQYNGRISNKSRGFPYNTQDLRAIGGLDKNTGDESMTVNVPTAYVVRTSQSDLNNPLSGGVTAADGTSARYTALGLANCAGGTFTASNGTGCKYDLVNQYRQIAPKQERYSINGRLSFRVSDSIEGYITGSFSRSYVSINGTPSAIRQTQPFGGSPTLASTAPGIVLPVYVCSSGVNCATAADRTLNSNNPYASAYANDPANGAARIYYLFGDIAAGSERTNDVYRFTSGFNGKIGESTDWRVEGVYARDNLKLTQHGLLNINNLMQAINTGAYNFLNPSANTDAVRNFIAPDKTTPSYSEMYGVDASMTRSLFELPGGKAQLAVGGQIRAEKLENRNQNVALDTYGLTTASAYGQHTVSAAYFEVDAPISRMLDTNFSGRFDHYSEGYSKFSPKVGVKFTPIKALALRGTYSEGFRAPTFAEAGPRSQYAGFVSTTPPCVFQLAHGGTSTANGCDANGNAYNTVYNLGRGVVGNPNLKPENSRSFTLGVISQPTRWFSFTVDYYNIKKSNLIVSGPLIGDAVKAYYNSTSLDAAKAAVAAVGPGYSVNSVDSIDPLYPNALPRVLIINVPYVNANYSVTSGLDFSATAKVNLPRNIKWTSRLEATYVIRYDLNNAGVLQRYAGTFGPYDLSSGNGTPRIRGNWQNTLEIGQLSLSLTTYYVGRIKETAADQTSTDTSCSQNLYKTGNNFCYVSPFINNDFNATLKINDRMTVYGIVKNLFDAKAPVAPAAYSSAPNFLTTWHYAGLVGREFRAGVNIKM